MFRSACRMISSRARCSTSSPFRAAVISRLVAQHRQGGSGFGDLVLRDHRDPGAAIALLGGGQLALGQLVLQLQQDTLGDFLPMPWATVRAFSLPVMMAVANPSGVVEERMDSAALGPTPETDSSI